MNFVKAQLHDQCHVSPTRSQTRGFPVAPRFLFPASSHFQACPVPGGQLGFMSHEWTHLACSLCVPQRSGFEIHPFCCVYGNLLLFVPENVILFLALVTLLSSCHSSLGGREEGVRVRELRVCIIFLTDAMCFI